MNEDYVSFETAKLLKEKGFRCDTLHYYYDKDGDLLFSAWRVDTGKNELGAPTLQMAMKWLMEVHKLYCDIRVGDGDFVVDIISLKDGEFGCEVVEPESCVYLTYEQACEAAIKYCLENLI